MFNFLRPSGRRRPARIRDYPWPYHAAFAFSNDCDYLTLDAMLALHRLFATQEADGGLGLDFSDSFFFYQNGSLYRHYSYFEDASSEPSVAAPIIRELVQTGHIDTCHGLGDFEIGGFSRRLSEQARDEFARYGLTVPIWSNHGGLGNWQNVGRKEFATYHSGDDFFSPHYHLDVLEELGCRYFWTDVAKCKTISLAPDGLVATERERRAPKTMWVSPLQRRRKHRLEWSYDRKNVLEVVNTRSAKLQGFVRYDGFFADGDADLDPEALLTPRGVRAGPNIGRLAASLTDELLGKLIETRGCCFLYQHLSTLAHYPERIHITRALEFHPDNLAALRRLRGYNSRGEIWVATQRHLLDYLYVTKTCEVAHWRTEQDTLIFKATVRSGFEFRGLAGLTFAIDPDLVESGTENLTVKVVDCRGETTTCTVVGPTSDGTIWACVPLPRLAKLDWRAIAHEVGIDLPEEVEVTLLDGSQPVDLHMPRSLTTQ